MAKAIVKNRPEYMFEVSFWRNVLLALAAPKSILKILRTIRTIVGTQKMSNITTEINLENNLVKALQKH